MRLREIALRIQKKLAKKVIICPIRKPSSGMSSEQEDNISRVESFLTASVSSSSWLVAAADVGFRHDRVTAGVALYELNTGAKGTSGLDLLEEAVFVANASSVRFPYLPGFLAFREIPPIIKALKKLSRRPHVILCDGHGIAHPRYIGLASHLGLILNTPSVGCAKSKLCGYHEELPTARGSYVALKLNGEDVGVVYRSRRDVKPIYISPGHLSDIPSSVKLVEYCLGKYRIPQPLRRAHLLTVRK